MKSKFSAIFALALTAMLLAVPFVGGGESDAAGQVVDKYSRDFTNDTDLVNYILDSNNRDKLLSFEGDSNRILNFTNERNWYPDVDLAGETITIKVTTHSEKHGVYLYADNFVGGTASDKGTVIFAPVKNGCDHGNDYRGFCPLESGTVTFSNVNFEWDATVGGMLVRTGPRDVNLNGCNFGSEDTNTGIGFYVSGGDGAGIDVSIADCTFTNCEKDIEMNHWNCADSIDVPSGDCPEIYVSTSNESELAQFVNKITVPAGESPNVMAKSGFQPADSILPPAQYTISFDVLSSTITATEGQPVSLPALPVKEGYYAVGWAYNGTLVGYMFTVTDSNVVLTACYEPIPAGDGEPVIIPGSSQTVIEEASLGTDDIVVIAMCVLALLVLGFLFFIIKTS